MTSVAHVEPCEILRTGMRTVLGRTSDLEVVVHADGPSEIWDALTESRPDLIVTELDFPGGESGLDFLRRLRSELESSRVLVYTGRSESVFAQRVLQMGAMGFVSKFDPEERVVEMVRRVAAGRLGVSHRLSEELLVRTLGRPEEKGVRDPLAQLTDRELEVFRLVGRGSTTADIADRLDLARSTVSTYLGRIRKKLGCDSGAELTRIAVQWFDEP